MGGVAAVPSEWACLSVQPQLWSNACVHGQGPGKRTCASHIYAMPGVACSMQSAMVEYIIYIYMSIHNIYIGGQRVTLKIIWQYERK